MRKSKKSDFEKQIDDYNYNSVIAELTKNILEYEKIKKNVEDAMKQIQVPKIYVKKD